MFCCLEPSICFNETMNGITTTDNNPDVQIGSHIKVGKIFLSKYLIVSI